MNQTLINQLEHHRARLLNYVRRQVDDSQLAEDIFQDSLLKALRAAPNLADQDKLLPWFFRILQNAVTDLYRRRASQPTVVRDADNLLESLPDEPSDRMALCDCFIDLLPGIKAEYAELIRRLDLEGESSEAVAESLNISRNNLKVRHHRARQALKVRLEEACRLCARHHCLDCTCTRD